MPHRGRILGDSGKSLADVYDVDGSVVPIENINGEDIHLVHEMGGTIMSERLAGEHFRLGTGPHLQNVTFNATMAGTDLAPLSRILAIQVMALQIQAGRTDRLAVMLQDAVSGREIPLWIWDATTDPEVELNWSDSGAAVAANISFQPVSHIFVPSMLVGAGHQQPLHNIILRGVTGAFGAGNITYFLMVHMLFPHLKGISSLGLPVPSW